MLNANQYYIIIDDWFLMKARDFKWKENITD